MTEELEWVKKDIVGLSQNFTLATGYDNHIGSQENYGWECSLSKSECVELAGVMIERWQKFKEFAESLIETADHHD